MTGLTFGGALRAVILVAPAALFLTPILEGQEHVKLSVAQVRSNPTTKDSAAAGPDSLPTFEVASVRPSGPLGPNKLVPVGGRISGGPGTSDTGQVTYRRVPLKNLIRLAFNIEYDQISGPTWLESEHYDVVAKIPPGTNRERFNLMLQNLLVDRFKLQLHQQTKEFPSYALTVSRNGSKLKDTVEASDPSIMASPGPISPRDMKKDQNGFPILPRGVHASASLPRDDRTLSTFVKFSVSELADWLARMPLATITGRNTYSPGRVVDRTNLNGKYDFTLEFEGSVMTLLGDQSDVLASALEKQLGLHLERTRVALEVLFIDHVEKLPTDN